MEKREKKPIALILKILFATRNGEIEEPFTTADMKKWVNRTGVKNDETEKPYAKKSLDSILSNSDMKNIGSSNENSKILKSKMRGSRIKEYWFE